MDSADGAAVRISMTVGEAGEREGTLGRVVREETRAGDDAAEVTLAWREGRILPDLTIGANVAGALPLRANEGISNRGVSS